MSVLGKILAIDYGTNNVGLAVSDPDQIIAFAKEVIDAKEDLLQNLQQLIKAENIQHIMIGTPLRGNKDLDIAKFVKTVQDNFNIPVSTINEDYSSEEAYEKMEASGLSPQQQFQLKDAFAAQVMLQKYLDNK